MPQQNKHINEKSLLVMIFFLADQSTKRHFLDNWLKSTIVQHSNLPLLMFGHFPEPWQHA